MQGVGRRDNDYVAKTASDEQAVIGEKRYVEIPAHFPGRVRIGVTDGRQFRAGHFCQALGMRAAHAAGADDSKTNRPMILCSLLMRIPGAHIVFLSPTADWYSYS